MNAVVAHDQWLVMDDVAGDPFAQLEDFLTRHGFGVWDEPFVPAADGLVADLFLGYRLASALPGVTEPQPPEPCPLPALACRVRPAEGSAARCPAGSRWAGSRPRGRPPQHRAAVEAVREAIARGDVYQANIVAAPVGAVRRGCRRRRGRPRPAGRGARRRDARRRLVDRVGDARAVPAPPRGRRRDDADQGHASGVEHRPDRRRSQGSRRARDDRRPRAQRPRPGLRAAQRARSRPAGRAADGRRPPPGVPRAGPAAAGRGAGRAAARDLPRRVDHRRAQGVGDQPHRPRSSRSAAARRWARSAVSTRTGTSTWG